MIAQRIWALISENTVQNTIVCETYPAVDELAKLTLGTDAFAVEITQIPTGIGDSHENGIFKDKQGNVINPLPTAEQEVVTLKAKNTALETELYVFLSNAAMIGASLWTAWKNNSITASAQQSDIIMKNLKEAAVKVILDQSNRLLAEQEEAVNAAAEKAVQ